MPEWTPAKVAVVVLVAVTLLLGIIQFFPERSTRNFAATAVETAQLQCTNVNLAAYEGLQNSVKTDDGFSGGAYSPIGGVFIEGHLTNTSPNEIFLIFDTNISPISAGFADSTIISDASRWSRTLMEVKGSPLAKKLEPESRILYRLGPDRRIQAHGIQIRGRPSRKKQPGNKLEFCRSRIPYRKTD